MASLSKRNRSIGYFLIVVLLIVAPSLASLGLYVATGNPLFRPLGITEEALQSFRSVFGGVEILATVAWDEQRAGHVSRAEMRRALMRAFGAKGLEARIVFTESRRGTTVTYRVGKNTFGPYPQSRAAEGVSLAASAYRMYIPYEP